MQQPRQKGMVINMLKQLLTQRKLPDLFTDSHGKAVNADSWRARRSELIGLLNEEYGELPAPPVKLDVKTVSRESSFCAGKAVLQKLMLTCELEEGKSFSFPVRCAYPSGGGKYPVFVFPNFRPDVPDRYLPCEEIVDSGCAVVTFYYEDITSDDSDFTNGLAALLCPGGDNTLRGKICLWAWAAMRALDYALTRADTDTACTAVIGHSRLGKTALYAGALDERFTAVISNDSGCGGAALSRGKCGERIAAITERFGYWFRSSFCAYSGNEYNAPFDQHFLLALVAPRKLYIASAAEDSWADSDSEYLCLCEAARVWQMLGFDDFKPYDRLLNANEAVTGKRIGCHKRSGSHYLSRYDWQRFIGFVLNP